MRSARPQASRSSEVFAGLPIGLPLSLLLLFLVLLPPPSVLEARGTRIDGRDYTELHGLAARLGMQAYWLRSYETFRLRSRWTTIDAPKGGKALRINGLPVYLGFPLRESRGRLWIADEDYRHALAPILVPQAFAPRPGLSRIFLDPGHGGIDGGAENRARGVKEKRLTLDVALRLKRLLEAGGVEVLLSRDDDAAVPLAQRSALARRAKADLFLSLHFNAAENREASGFETFVLTPQHQASSRFAAPGAGDDRLYGGNRQDPWNTLFGYHIQRALVDRLGGPDRGLKRARFLVLKELDCPGALVELGFISHSPTVERLRSAAFRQTLAQALFEGIVAYRQRLARIQ